MSVTTLEAGAAAHHAAAPVRVQRAALVMNAAAGTASRSDADAIVARAQAALDAEVQPFIGEGASLECAVRDAFASNPDVVLVMGGDGTARAVAAHALKAETPIIPLPGGTMNVLAKLAFGHGALDCAIEDLRALQGGRLDVGYVGATPFFLSAAFGYAGLLAKLREAARPPRRVREIASAASALVRGLGPSLRGGVKWRAERGAWRKAHTLVVSLGAVERVLSPDAFAAKSCETLEAVSLRAAAALDIVRFGAHAAIANWRDFDRIERACADRILVDLTTSRPLIVLDGEPMRLSRIEDVRIARRALPILAPLRAQESAA
ncbi:MAG: diacylglycerol kinase family protein [Hyphomonadaceae bacterium]|nr:diacylglycerol kinase family protein [Hyphomonadaceae bacterium]